MTAFVLKQQSCVIATEAICPSKPEIFTIYCFPEKAGHPLVFHFGLHTEIQVRVKFSNLLKSLSRLPTFSQSNITERLFSILGLGK